MGCDGGAGWWKTDAHGAYRAQSRWLSGSGPALEELVIDNGTTTSAPLTYPAATVSKERATLTVRSRYSDVPVRVTNWEFADDRSVRLLPAGTPFSRGRYELAYQAKDPLVAGLAFAATRIRSAVPQPGRHRPHLLVLRVSALPVHA